MAVVFDERWMGLHGIGRFATELSRRLTLQNLGLPRSPSHPLDCVAMSASMLRRPRDVFFSPGYNAPVLGLSRYVFVVHDLNHIDVDANSNVLKRLYYRFVLKRACRNALGLLTVSEFTARRIAAWAGVPRDRIHVVGNGVSAAFSTQGDTHAEGCDYFLVVGNRKDHKNEARVIAAFAALAANRKNVRLVLTGMPSAALQIAIDRCALGQAVKFTGALSDAELAAYYRGAVGLVFPSLYEGFGLPVVEAMSCGTPVITSTTTSLPEVAGGAALLVDPLSTEAIAAAMARLLDEPLLRQELGRLGLAQARQFSWDVVSNRVELLLQKFRSKVAP